MKKIIMYIMAATALISCGNKATTDAEQTERV